MRWKRVVPKRSEGARNVSPTTIAIAAAANAAEMLGLVMVKNSIRFEMRKLRRTIGQMNAAVVSRYQPNNAS